MPYASDLDCLFNITTAPSNVLQIAFLAFDLADRNPKSDQCLEAYFLVIVVDRQGKEHLGERICGSNVPEPIHTMQSSLQIQFVTTLVSGSHKGFRIQYRMLSEAAILEPPSFINEDFPPCGGHSNPLQLTGEIQSPGYPETYPSNATCNWLIRVEPRQRIYIRIVHFNLSATIAECNRASLIVFDGYRHEMVDDEKKYSPTGANDPSEARFCGSQAYYAEEGMLSYMSTANRIIVRMVTHDKPRRSDDDIDHGVQIGFKIVWTAVESLISEGGIDEEEEGISGEDECDEFVCKGGQICMEEAQGICASRSRLCIHKSLVCNGVHNCADGDFSDEAHCYSREIIIISAIAFSFVLLTICICVCCDQYRKKQKLRRMIRERREENGTAKMQTQNSERTAARRPMLENKR
ncbi:hypothetical protein WR25_00609 [Diploscapter pachys]|uniref:CUB domain-containing protein n=1 Tax=Diploscapter pachys TaxID=2018661 RepID=A0A2A2KHW1_9BILA|nr:hypothetical protein WR25_00609 [Diploscapter pachys]